MNSLFCVMLHATKKKKTQVCDSKTALCSEKPILGSEENKPGIIL